VNFPTPYYPLVSPDVLVESFEAGRHISAFIVPGRRHPYSHRLAELGSGTMLQVGAVLLVGVRDVFVIESLRMNGSTSTAPVQ
jgi:hypothetical protein